MEIKINIPLIDKITALFAKAEPQTAREQTSETSVEVGLISYYFKKMKLERTRKAKYGDYVIMDDEYPEISTALDLYADNATKEREEDGSPFKVRSKESRVQNMLNDLVERTKLKDSIWETARRMAKMGDDFDEVVVDKDNWITKLKNLQAEQMQYEIDEYGNPAEKPYVQKEEAGTGNVAEFEDWQIVHWKNGGVKSMYGESVMKSIRRVYKQLQMMEDGMVIGRLTRSHLRYKILVDVEGMDSEEAKKYVADVKKEFRKKRMVDPTTGQLITGQNPLSAEEDFFLGVNKDSKADVSVLQGSTNLGNIRDVEYFQTKLFTGLKVPKAFMGVEKDVKAKATVVEEDIQFARTVGRIRKGLRIGMTKLFNRQLTLQGVTPYDGLFEILFAPISLVDEMRKWTMEKLKAEVAKLYKVDAALLPDEFILKKIVGLTDDEIKSIAKAKPAPLPTTLPTKIGAPSLRAAGASGVTTPAAGAMSPMVSQKIEGSNGEDKEAGLYIATLKMMDLVETLRDLVDLELNR
jgi:hypothetical protein